MSYFATGYHTKNSVIKDFENSFIDVIPGEIKKDVLRIEDSKVFLIIYGINKVIKDFVFCDEKTGSWLALLGTPLVNLSTEDKKTMLRTFLFMPEYFSEANRIMSGAVNRLFKWTESNKPAYRWTENSPSILTLLNKWPYTDWFSSSKFMITGYLYNNDVVDSLFARARAGQLRDVSTLGRIINQELAYRWVYNEK